MFSRFRRSRPKSPVPPPPPPAASYSSSSVPAAQSSSRSPQFSVAVGSVDDGVEEAVAAMMMDEGLYIPGLAQELSATMMKRNIPPPSEVTAGVAAVPSTLTNDETKFSNYNGSNVNHNGRVQDHDQYQHKNKHLFGGITSDDDDSTLWSGLEVGGRGKNNKKITKTAGGAVQVVHGPSSSSGSMSGVSARSQRSLLRELPPMFESSSEQSGSELNSKGGWSKSTLLNNEDGGHRSRASTTTATSSRRKKMTVDDIDERCPRSGDYDHDGLDSERISEREERDAPPTDRDAAATDYHGDDRNIDSEWASQSRNHLPSSQTGNLETIKTTTTTTTNTVDTKNPNVVKNTFDDDNTTAYTWGSVNELIRPKGIIKMVSEFNFFDERSSNGQKKEEEKAANDDDEVEIPPPPVQSPQSNTKSNVPESSELRLDNDDIMSPNTNPVDDDTVGKSRNDEAKGCDEFHAADSSSKDGEKSILDILVDFEKTMDEGLKDFQSDNNTPVVNEKQHSTTSSGKKASRSFDDVEKEGGPRHSYQSNQKGRHREEAAQEKTMKEVKILRENIEQYKSEIERMDEEHRSEMKLLEDRHKQQISDLKAMYQAEIDRVAAEKDAAVVEASQKAEQFVEQSRNEVSSVMEELQKYKNLSMAAVQSELAETAKAIKAQKDEEATARLENLRASYETEIERIRNDCEETVEKEKEKIAESIVKRMKASHDEEITVVIDELNELLTWQRTMSKTLTLIRDNFDIHYPKEMARARRSGRFTEGNARKLLPSQDGMDSIGPDTSRLLDEVLEVFAFLLESTEKKADMARLQSEISKPGVDDHVKSCKPEYGLVKRQFELRHLAELEQLRQRKVETEAEIKEMERQRNKFEEQNLTLQTEQIQTRDYKWKENPPRRSLSSQMENDNVEGNEGMGRDSGRSEHARSCHSRPSVHVRSMSPSVRKARSFRLSSPGRQLAAYQRLGDSTPKDRDEKSYQESSVAARKRSAEIHAATKTSSAKKVSVPVAFADTDPAPKEKEEENNHSSRSTRSFRGRSIRTIFCSTKNSQNGNIEKNSGNNSPTKNDSVRSLPNERISRLSISTTDMGTEKKLAIQTPPSPFEDKTPKIKNRGQMDTLKQSSRHIVSYPRFDTASLKMTSIGSFSQDSDAENAPTREIVAESSSTGKDPGAKKRVYRNRLGMNRPTRQFRDFSTTPSQRSSRIDI